MTRILKNPETPIGLYDLREEHDACGVGVVAAIDGSPRRDVVTRAIEALKNVWHRGAVAADGKTGDGAGLRIGLPQQFFRAVVRESGHEPGDAAIGVGMVFLPRTDFAAQDRARAVIESEILAFGFRLFGWRQVPIDETVIGDEARAVRPEIEQILFRDERNRSQQEVARDLFIVRRRIETRALEERLREVYLCSLSMEDVIYKGMFRAQDIAEFYHDLQDERVSSAFAIFHQRYSTNTFPEWRLAQPFRMLAHNGEINTIRGNVRWMDSHEPEMASRAFGEHGSDVKPVIQEGSSDSAALDAVYELLVRAGRSGPMAKALLMPEAWSKRGEVMRTEVRALYEYCNAVMEPWDGPAGICAFDGRFVVAGLDRNGLRPLRYALTADGLLAVGSETGMCPLTNEEVIERGAVAAGGMIAADLSTGEFLRQDDIIDRLVTAHPYKEWLGNVIELDDELADGPEPQLFEAQELRRRQRLASLTQEDLELILRPMAETGKEAIGSMGDDTPLAVLSQKYRPLPHFFRQRFSQVTNPPIDPLREGRVMSLKTRFKNLGNILAEDETQTDVFVLDSPILTNGMYARLADKPELSTAVVDCTFAIADSGQSSGRVIEEALDKVAADAVMAVRNGSAHIVLSDEAISADRMGLPMVLATSHVHSALIGAELRSSCSITVRSAETVDSHACAVLIGVGATAVNPYVAIESLGAQKAKGLYPSRELHDLAQSYKAALDAGLLKILSKMGVSVISSYRGGMNFEVLGLSRSLVDAYFPGMASRLSGLGLAGIETKLRELHADAYKTDISPLAVGGFYRVRQGGEDHAYEAKMISALQRAVREDDEDAYREFSKLNGKGEPSQLRDLLDFREQHGIPLDEVESANAIRQRFLTPGMSLGALSPEAHGALNAAMNRIGAKSVSGEGGEDPSRYKPTPSGDNYNSAVKQIASGRFGVTAEYLNQCREIEIKVAQGAKPGEGGQLPGFKVTEFVAKMRHSKPGVTLISPPPHHDIYSIEDLAQLIFDLKQVNPSARVCVKLVASAGVGTIAAGVAKGKADVILISGNVGGTGASPQTSIKFAGSPWELGLAEVNQVLSLNGLRNNVTLRTDGGIKTGRDVVMAAMLGAEEYGLGTLSLVAMGCLMVRQCHSNTCPVGICTQNASLREHFTGKPEHVVRLMTFIAEEVREILASLGMRSLDEVIGRSDLLRQASRGSAMLDDLDLGPLLVRTDASDRPPVRNRKGRQDPGHSLDEQILGDAAATFERREKLQLTYTVRNTDRAVGTQVSGQMARSFGPEGLPDGHLSLLLRGSAGQSLGAFGMKGLSIDVTGDANDYVGKGLSGAVLSVRPPRGEVLTTPSLVGNTCLYGATSGSLFVAGRAGERFAVRNSGATAVVEGCGNNGCEYMTGGAVLILGEVGDNFAAGMTGGIAFILDRDDTASLFHNPETTTMGALGADEAQCRDLLERHVLATGSELGAALLPDWTNVATSIRTVRPRADVVDSSVVTAQR
ncbi:MAG: glutamate synthase large subunit [Parvularculaceae bacterium]|nr:glutamate synthase large subunit [Parvularculaceae bacterium]